MTPLYQEKKNSRLTSILMPVKNESRYLSACLSSIENPQGCPIEVIIVDDNSTDDTYKIACETSAARKDLSCQVLRNNGQGKAAALNLAYTHAKGDAFILLAGDDLLVSELIPVRSMSVSGLSPMIASCRYRSFSDNPLYDGTIFPRPGREDSLAGGATSFNKAFAELYFPIPPELPNEDTWLRAIAILFALKPIIIDKIGLHYRIHDQNSTGPALNFTATNQGLVSRHAAFLLALDRFDGGSEKGKAKLAAFGRAEACRAAGNWLKICFLKNLSRSDRAVFLANSTWWLFWMKNRLLPYMKNVRNGGG